MSLSGAPAVHVLGCLRMIINILSEFMGLQGMIHTYIYPCLMFQHVCVIWVNGREESEKWVASGNMGEEASR